MSIILKAIPDQKLEDGLHVGTIIDVTMRTEPFEYVELLMETTEDKIKKKVSFPATLSPSSKLGVLLEALHVKFNINDQIDLNVSLVGKLCQFQTLTQKGKDGKMYSNIISESVKLAKK